MSQRLPLVEPFQRRPDRAMGYHQIPSPSGVKVLQEGQNVGRAPPAARAAYNAGDDELLSVTGSESSTESRS
ncbi:MAG TPA: hypothetical protein VFK05_02285 [Polyangiaceae bacterium]|nr:hypothetical protein [Polyangiaceae bacterium]